jgi:hypothetical protein
VPELAAGAVWAVEILMETFAKLSLVILGHVGLGVEFVRAMGERATLFEDAGPGQLPVLAKLGFVLGSEI